MTDIARIRVLRDRMADWDIPQEDKDYVHNMFMDLCRQRHETYEFYERRYHEAWARRVMTLTAASCVK